MTGETAHLDRGVSTAIDTHLQSAFLPGSHSAASTTPLFIDPTIQQFAEVPDSGRAVLPVVARLPAPAGLGEQPFGVDRVDHSVVYLPLLEREREAWHAPVVDSHTAAYRGSSARTATAAVPAVRCRNGLGHPADFGGRSRAQSLLRGTTAAIAADRYEVSRQSGSRRSVAPRLACSIWVRCLARLRPGRFVGA